MSDGTIEIREVVVGAMDRVNAQVISGLNEGDQVVAGIVQAEAEGQDDSSGNNSDDRMRSQFRMMRGAGVF